jgi:hypothetical protein
LGFGVYEFALRDIPVPAIVQRRSLEPSIAKTGPAQRYLSAATEGNNYVNVPENQPAPRTEDGDVTNPKVADDPSLTTEALMPDDSALSDELREERRKINEVYTECMAILEDCQPHAEGLSYGEKLRKLKHAGKIYYKMHPLMNKHFRMEQEKTLGERLESGNTTILDHEGYHAVGEMLTSWRELSR